MALDNADLNELIRLTDATRNVHLELAKLNRLVAAYLCNVLGKDTVNAALRATARGREDE